MGIIFSKNKFIIMGPCPSNMNWFECLYSDSYQSQSWHDSSLVLPALGADPQSVTVSGFAGGGIFASSVQLIYSDIIAGAGIIEGGPYGSKGNINNVQSDGGNTMQRALYA